MKAFEDKEKPGEVGFEVIEGVEGPGAAEADPLEHRLGDRLEKTADEAKMLLRYASTHGVEIPNEVVKEICEADSRSATGERVDPDDETRFFAAFRELSKLVAPVSVDSLIACEDIYAPWRRSMWTFRKVRRCAAKRAAAKFMAITVVVLVLLLAVQSYWFVGQRILHKFEAATQTLQTREFLAARAGTGAEDPGEQLLTSGVTAFSASEFANLNEEELRNALSGYGVALAQWSSWMDFLPQPEAAQLSRSTAAATPDEPVDDAAGGAPAEGGSEAAAGEEEGSSFDDFEVGSDVAAAAPAEGGAPAVAVPSQGAASRTYRVMMARSVLDVIQSFILPLAYGLIGACAFVLRALVTETHRKTYLPEKAGGYMLRLTLGLLAGLGVGYLFKDQIGGDSALGALSPLALAFVAGYSVELLFSLMDRLIPKNEESAAPAKS